MTRVKISAAVLGLMIGASVFVSIWVNRQCSEMLCDISSISALAENGQTKAAAERAKLLEKRWESFLSRASVLLKYDKLVEADRLCSRIVQLAESGSSELEAELAELRDMLEMMKSGETPLLSSIF